MLNGLDDLRELLNLVFGLFQVLLVLLFRLKKTIGLNDLVLGGVEVNFVAHILELVRDLLQELSLNDEIGNVFHVHAQLTDALGKPNLELINSSSGDAGQKKLDAVVEFLGGGLQLGFDLLGVELKHANVSGCREVRLEMALVEFEELHNMANSINTVFEFLVN